MATLKIEVGSVNVPNVYRQSGYVDVVFTNTYTHPVVIVYMSTYNGSDPCDARVTNVTGIGCTIFIDEDSTGSHQAETVSYIVLEAGRYTLPDGTILEAGTKFVPATAKHSWQQDVVALGNYVDVTFSKEFDANPAFFASINTFNNLGASTYTRISAGSTDVTTTGAKIFQEVSRATTNVTRDENFSWLAIDSSKVGDFLGQTFFETQRFRDGSADGVTDTPRHVFNHLYDYNQVPIVFAHGVTLDDLGGYWARAFSTSTPLRSEVLAEVSYGDSRSHQDEEFSFLAFEEAFAAVYEEVEVVEVFANNVWTQNPYIYRPDATGLSVYDLSSEALVNFVEFNGGAKSVWATDNKIYLGTTYSGVYIGDVSSVSGTLILTPFKTYPDILSNEVNYLHGKGDYLCVVSSAGVDKYNLLTDDRYSTTVSGVSKCYQTSDGTFYYIKNPEIGFFQLDESFLSWSYVKRVTLATPAPHDDYIYFIEIPRGSPHDIVSLAKSAGEDLRVVDDNGYTIPFFIEHWNKVDNPQLWVRLSEGVKDFYILYGNVAATSRSSGNDTFLLYDDFNSPELDTDKWAFSDGGYALNEYIIEDSIILLKSKSNSYNISLTSEDTFYGGIIEAHLRRTSASTVTDYDGIFGFNGGVYAAIGVQPYDSTSEHPHWLISNSDWGTVKGNKLMSTEFLDLTVKESLYYQSSQYGDEILVSSGTLNNFAYRKVKFQISSAATQPDLEIDWARVRNFDPDPPPYTVHPAAYTFQYFDSVELHAVYGNTTSGFVYEAASDNVLVSNYINDIYVTENTSIYGGNVIFLGTSFGATVVEEKRGDELNSRKRVYLIQA